MTVKFQNELERRRSLLKRSGASVISLPLPRVTAGIGCEGQGSQMSSLEPLTSTSGKSVLKGTSTPWLTTRMTSIVQ